MCIRDRPTASFSSVPNSLKLRRLKARRRDCLIVSDTFVNSQETVTLNSRKLTERLYAVSDHHQKYTCHAKNAIVRVRADGLLTTYIGNYHNYPNNHITGGRVGTYAPRDCLGCKGCALQIYIHTYIHTYIHHSCVTMPRKYRVYTKRRPVNSFSTRLLLFCVAKTATTTKRQRRVRLFCVVCEL